MESHLSDLVSDAGTSHVHDSENAASCIPERAVEVVSRFAPGFNLIKRHAGDGLVAVESNLTSNLEMKDFRGIRSQRPFQSFAKERSSRFRSSSVLIGTHELRGPPRVSTRAIPQSIADNAPSAGAGTSHGYFLCKARSWGGFS